MTKAGNYKTIAGITVLIAVFAFLYFFSGVFGDTRLGVTIRSNPDLNNGLVGHWTFDSTSMDVSSSTKEVYDVSGNENHGDWRDHASTTLPGVIGQALDFDGVDDTIDIGGDPAELKFGADPFTLAIWFKAEDKNHNSPFFSKA